MWTGVYDCVFFCVNQDLYESLSPEMQALVDEAGAYCANQQRRVGREGDAEKGYLSLGEVVDAWTAAGMTISELSDDAVAELKEATSGVAAEWVQQCVTLGFDQAEVENLVEIFSK